MTSLTPTNPAHRGSEALRNIPKKYSLCPCASVCRDQRQRRLAAASWVLILALGAASVGHAAGQGERAPEPARAAAPVDLTGYWVSIITEDWRWRMMTPPKGDYASVPLNPEGRRVADQWDQARDEAKGEQCRAYGVGGIMRMPLRAHITWADDWTLKIETDAGRQTRLLHFREGDARTRDRTWQGRSVASWEGGGVLRRRQAAEEVFLGRLSDVPDGTRAPIEYGTLKVITTGMRAGYLRKNGVPYSENAVVTEYFDRHGGPGGAEWFTVTTIVDDKLYLGEPFVTSSHFRREPDASKWRPTPCEVDRPPS